MHESLGRICDLLHICVFPMLDGISTLKDVERKSVLADAAKTVELSLDYVCHGL